MQGKDKLVLAADIGGTHITSALVDIQTWQILEDTISRSHVNSKSEAKTILLGWKDCLSTSLSQTEVNVPSLGIAMPGPFDYENGISLIKGQDKYEALYQLNVKDALNEMIDQPLTIRLINDAAAFLQGEVFAANLANREKVLGITLGTGLGSAIWKKGAPAYDADLWNSPYQESIFEEFLVTRWFTRRFFELSGIQEEGVKAIIQQHKEHPQFATLMEEYTAALYDFLCFFAERENCNTFIIGGSISKSWALISSYNSEKFERLEIFIGQYAEKAALIGAASLFK